jgi:hypothetical protein
VGFEQQEVRRNKKDESFENVYGTRFDPVLIVDEDRYEDREEHKVADDHEWQIGDRTLAEVGEGDAAHRKQKEIGEKKRDTDGDKNLGQRCEV